MIFFNSFIFGYQIQQVLALKTNFTFRIRKKVPLSVQVTIRNVQ